MFPLLIIFIIIISQNPLLSPGFKKQITISTSIYVSWIGKCAYEARGNFTMLSLADIVFVMVILNGSFMILVLASTQAAVCVLCTSNVFNCISSELRGTAKLPLLTFWSSDERSFCVNRHKLNYSHFDNSPGNALASNQPGYFRF